MALAIVLLSSVSWRCSGRIILLSRKIHVEDNLLLPPLCGSGGKGTQTGGYAPMGFTPGYYLSAPTVLFPCLVGLDSVFK